MNELVLALSHDDDYDEANAYFVSMTGDQISQVHSNKISLDHMIRSCNTSSVNNIGQ